MSDSGDVIQRTETLDDGVCLVLSGEVDLSTSPVLREHLLSHVESRPDRLLIDLSDVPYMDSSGVATLVEALQHQRRNNWKMILTGLQDKVRSIFEIARLDSVFMIVEDLETAKTA